MQYYDKKNLIIATVNNGTVWQFDVTNEPYKPKLIAEN